jgi:predicted DNA binding CopG/RHH family protein
MKKPLPNLQTDAEAERFVAEADLTEYDLSGLRTMQFEFQPKSERLNLRVPKGLLDAVKAAAASVGIPYQRYIRQTLEAAVRRPRKET